MRYMRCKCGSRECWTSMGHPACDGCEKCNTTLEESPSRHTEPEAHEWGAPEWNIDARTGDRWQEQQCERCWKRQRLTAEASET